MKWRVFKDTGRDAWEGFWVAQPPGELDRIMFVSHQKALRFATEEARKNR